MVDEARADDIRRRFLDAKASILAGHSERKACQMAGINRTTYRKLAGTELGQATDVVPMSTRVDGRVLTASERLMEELYALTLDRIAAERSLLQICHDPEYLRTQPLDRIALFLKTADDALIRTLAGIHTETRVDDGAVPGA